MLSQLVLILQQTEVIEDLAKLTCSMSFDLGQNLLRVSGEEKKHALGVKSIARKSIQR